MSLEAVEMESSDELPGSGGLSTCHRPASTPHSAASPHVELVVEKRPMARQVTASSAGERSPLPDAR